MRPVSPVVFLLLNPCVKVLLPTVSAGWLALSTVPVTLFLPKWTTVEVRLPMFLKRRRSWVTPKLIPPLMWGIDAAHKLTILAAHAFGTGLAFNETFTEGISAVTPDDFRYARELGYRIKHLGIARRTEQGIEQRVHPTLIPEQHLLASVNGVMNGVLIKVMPLARPCTTEPVPVVNQRPPLLLLTLSILHGFWSVRRSL